MDLIENIRIFKRVTERLSFSAVSQEMNVSQPTISKAIAGLESSLGVSLFRRSTRGMSLTSEGQKLLIMGAPLLDHVDALLASVKNEKLLLTGQLRVTASLGFARLILAPLFEEFSELHPGIKLHFHLRDSYIDLIENGIDVAIRIGELSDSSLRAIKIGISRRMIYASQSYLKKHGRPKSLEDLSRHRLLFYTGTSDRPSWNLRPKPLNFEPYFQSDGSDLIREAVLNGTGIGLMPTWMMINQEKAGKVVRLFEKNAPEPSPIFLVTTGAPELTAKQRSVADFLKNRFESIPELSQRETR